MNLEEITALEEEWLGKQGRLEHEWLQKVPPDRPKGHSLQQLDRMGEETGVYDAWRRIFGEYVVLAREGNIEALKRAIFLVWFECAEPAWLSNTGVWGLDMALVKEVLHMANTMAKEDRLDAELQWMLPWYYMIADFYLRAEGLDDLRKASEKDPHAFSHVFPKGCLRSTFDNRGQLGRYWSDLWDGANADSRARGEFP